MSVEAEGQSPAKKHMSPSIGPGGAFSCIFFPPLFSIIMRMRNVAPTPKGIFR